MTVDTWVRARFADVQRRELGNSLRSVGATKPLGSLGFPNAWAMAQAFWRLRRTHWRRATFWPVTGAGGMYWLYVWRERDLQSLLAGNAETLLRAGWPPAPRPFVERVRVDAVAPGTPLYSLIADAYGDRLNPGRPEVMPGTDPRVLLEAFEAHAGFPDPAAIYFRLGSNHE